MEGRDAVCHIALVRRTKASLIGVEIVQDRRVQLCHGLRVERADGAIRSQVGILVDPASVLARLPINRLGPHSRIIVDLGAGCECGAVQAVRDAALEGSSIGQARAADVVLCRRAGRDDVGPRAALEDHAVNAVCGAHLLSQHADAVVAEHDSIQGIEALGRGQSRVGGPAGEASVELLVCERACEGCACVLLGGGDTASTVLTARGRRFARHGAGSGVDHQAGIDTVVGAGVEELHLTTASFFCRSA